MDVQEGDGLIRRHTDRGWWGWSAWASRSSVPWAAKLEWDLRTSAALRKAHIVYWRWKTPLGRAELLLLRSIFKRRVERLHLEMLLVLPWLVSPNSLLLFLNIKICIYIHVEYTYMHVIIHICRKSPRSARGRRAVCAAGWTGAPLL